MMRRALRPVARAVREARAHTLGMIAWAAETASGPPCLWYGQRIPGPAEHAVGGIVKLQHLERTFPASARRFNVLYLVSSRLLRYPADPCSD